MNQERLRALIRKKQSEIRELERQIQHLRRFIAAGDWPSDSEPDKVRVAREMQTPTERSEDE